METNDKTIHRFFFSLAGIITMAIFLIGLNVIADQYLIAIRLDCTADKQYTFSQGTRMMLDRLQFPVTFRFYYSRKLDGIPLELKEHAQRVEDLLKEYVTAANGKIRLEIFNPSPDTDSEDKAALDGIQEQALPNGESLYLGMVISSLDNTLSLPFLTPNTANRLEYDISSGIYRVTHPDKPLIGILSSLPIFGGPAPPRPPHFQQTPMRPWLFVEFMKKDYQVESIPVDTENISQDLSLLIIHHPKSLSDKTLFAIDQYLLAGGKLIVFVDPFSEVEAMFQNAPVPSSNLAPLFDAWKIQFDPAKVLVDMHYVFRQVSKQNPGILGLHRTAMNAAEPSVSSLNLLLLWKAGVFSGDPVSGVRKTVLVHSSEQSMLSDRLLLSNAESDIMQFFSPSNTEYALILRLDGTFPSAFPDGIPSNTIKTNPDKDKKEKILLPKDKQTVLKQSSVPSSVVLIGDADMLYDQFWARQIQGLFVMFSDNNNILNNLVEQFSSDRQLMHIRSRSINERPLEKVVEIQAAAEAKYKKELQLLTIERRKAEQRFQDLQQAKDDSRYLLLSDAQRAEEEKWKERVIAFKRKERELAKATRKDIDQLEFRIKIANILAVPLLIICFGVLVSIFRWNGYKRSRQFLNQKRT